MREPVDRGDVRFLRSRAHLASGKESLQDLQWSDGIAITIALWSFTLLIYLPTILDRYDGMGVRSVLLDCSTILVSMLFAMPLFALFRLTLPLSGHSRVIVMVVAALTVAVVQSVFDWLFTAFVANNLEVRWRTMPNDLWVSYGAALNYAGVFSVNCALFQLAAARRKSARQERELADFHAQAQQAEVNSLRLKLNPHFLFNTLNVISAMVVTRRNEEAERGLGLLSSFLRASIAGDPSATRPLEEQLQLLDHYLDLEEMRFGERLVVDLHYDDDVADLAVPSLLIQPLVEMAIRDGVELSTAPVRIGVSAHRAGGDLELQVSCDAAPTMTDHAREAVDAIRARLSAAYGVAASITVRAEQGGVATTVRLPAVPA